MTDDLLLSLNTESGGDSSTFLDYANTQASNLLDSLTGEDVKTQVSTLDSLYPTARYGHTWSDDEIITKDKLQDLEARSSFAINSCFSNSQAIKELMNKPEPTFSGFKRDWHLLKDLSDRMIKENVPISYHAGYYHYPSGKIIEEGVISQDIFHNELVLLYPEIFELPLEGDSDEAYGESTYFDFVQRTWLANRVRLSSKDEFDVYSYLPKDDFFYINCCQLTPSDIKKSGFYDGVQYIYDTINYDNVSTWRMSVHYSEETGKWTGKSTISSSIALIVTIDPELKRVDAELNFDEEPSGPNDSAASKIGILLRSAEVRSADKGFSIIGAHFSHMNYSTMGPTSGTSGAIEAVTTYVTTNSFRCRTENIISYDSGNLSSYTIGTDMASQVKWFDNPYAEENQ